MDEILSSIRRIISDEPPARAGRRPQADSAAVAEPAAAPAETRPETAGRPAPANDDRGLAALLSAEREAETASAFASLNHTVFSRNARTIEDVVQEMLRPMLQNWLDAHLPALVERLVRQEIERISGRS